MSKNHYIIPKQKYDLDYFFSLVTQVEGVRYVHRGNQIYYFWMQGKSTRGMDFSIEEDRIEIRNTIFSNEADYFITCLLVKMFTDEYRCKVVDEYGKRIKKEMLYGDKEAVDNFFNDFKSLKLLVEKGVSGVITLYCPNRKVHIGKRVLKMLENLEEKAAILKLEKLIQDINYSYPDFKYGDVLTMKNDDGEVRIDKLKVLDNSTPLMLDCYDYFMMENIEKEGEHVFITNDQLNTILPPDWKLLDDYTVLAPVIDIRDWAVFLVQALKMDMSKEIFDETS